MNNDPIVLETAFFRETGTYNDMAARPYQTSISRPLIQTIVEATQGGFNAGATTIAPYATQIVAPSADKFSNVFIENGWDCPRFRFIMTFRYYDNQTNSTQVKIVQGYTNYNGATLAGNVDPNMLLYFNNVVTLRETRYYDKASNSYTSSKMNMVDATQVIRGNFQSISDSNNTYTVRPYDVLNKIANLNLGSECIETRHTFGPYSLIKSARKNTNPANYVSSIISRACDPRFIEDTQMGSDYSEVFRAASGEVSEKTVSGDEFFNHLTFNYNPFIEGGFVSYGELMSMFPNLDHIANFIMNGTANKVNNPIQNHVAGSTEYWTTSTTETMWANILSQSLPSIMMDLMIMRIGFFATNDTLDGQHYVELRGDIASFVPGIDIRPYGDRFIQRLIAEILTSVSYNNGISYSISCFVDAVGETRLTISVGGGPSYDYVSPSFCDGLYSPVIVNSLDHFDNTAMDFQNLVEEIKSGTPMGMTNQHYAGKRYDF